MATTIDGEKALTMGEAATFLGISYTAFRNKLKKYNDDMPTSRIIVYQAPHGREKYVKQSELGRLKELVPIEKRG